MFWWCGAISPGQPGQPGQSLFCQNSSPWRLMGGYVFSYTLGCRLLPVMMHAHHILWPAFCGYLPLIHLFSIETSSSRAAPVDLFPRCPEWCLQCWDTCAVLAIDFDCQINAATRKYGNVLGSLWTSWTAHLRDRAHDTVKIVNHYDTPLIIRA